MLLRALVLKTIMASLIALLGAMPALADSHVLTGEVTYRERIALPPDATLTVKLVHLPRRDEAPVITAQARIVGPGQVPLAFVLRFDREAVLAGQDYAVIAEIAAQDRVWFANQPLPLDPLAASGPLSIMVNFVDTPAQPTQSAAPHSPIIGVIWRLRTLEGKRVDSHKAPTLSIASDLRAGGSGGCNNYFTEAMIVGDQLSLGPVAATRMLCTPQIMDREQAFFAALERTAGFAMVGRRLMLRDAQGKTLATLQR